MTCFIDTSAFLAVMNQADEWHARAALAWSDLVKNARPLVSSSHILVETLALCQHRLGINAAKAFQNDVVPLLKTVWIDESTHRAAMSALLAAGKRHLSLVDCTSFAIMRQQGIETVFTFDRHFLEQGFTVLPAS